jgi:hypothetical protein
MLAMRASSMLCSQRGKLFLELIEVTACVLELDSAEWKSPLSSLKKLRATEDAEELAREVREKWELGIDPIPNMTELFEEKGLKVLMVALPERFSGFTCMVAQQEGAPCLPVIVVNSRFSLERRRLTLAHELAHRLIDPKRGEGGREGSKPLCRCIPDAERASSSGGWQTAERTRL